MPMLPPTCEWTNRCYGMDEAPDGPILVLAIRRGRQQVDVTPAADLSALGPDAVAAGLTEKEAWVRRVQTPLRSERKVHQVLPGMLDVQLPFGIEECAISCVSLGRTPASDGLTAVAVVARRTDMRSRLARWTAEGREPHVLDQEGLALWTQAAGEYPPRQPDEPRAVIYLGQDRATLAFGRGGELVATQGLRHFEPAQALRQARLAFEGDPGPISWIWTGPGAADAAVLMDFRRAMGLAEPVRDLVMKEPRTVLARAYAIRALQAGPLRCDLRSGEWAHPGVKRLREKRETFAASLLLASGLILLTGSLLWKGLLEQRETTARSAVGVRARAVMNRLGGGQAINPGFEVRSVSNALAAAESHYAPFVRAQSPARSRSLGRLLMAAREGNLVLFRFTWDDRGLKVEGRAETDAACEAFRRLVEKETGQPATWRADKKDAHGVRFVMETLSGR